jgi:Flp pilus assembly protein TadD
VRLLLLAVCLAVNLSAQAPAKLQELESRAISLKSKGDAAGALAVYQEAAILTPQLARLQDEIGFLLVVLNRQAEAVEHFNRAIELDPKFASAHYHLGVVRWLEKGLFRGICG